MKKTILFLSPHTDDVELGCGGTIARFVSEGHQVIIVAFTLCDTVTEGYTKDELHKEWLASCRSLGANTILFDYEVRYFNDLRQEIFTELETLRNEYKPDMVFVPSVHDLHQDHATIANEALRVFKKTNIFCYEVPLNNLLFNNTAYIEIQQPHLYKKIQALSQYESQQDKNYFHDSYIKSLARVRGAQIGKEYAECFEVKRFVI